MILPKDRYRFRKRVKKRKKRIFFLFLLIIPVILAILFFTNKDIVGLNKVVTNPKPKEQPIDELWKNQHYETINNKCESILKEKPMDQVALVYNGFSYFYRGISQYSLEEKLSLIDRAIINLRRALIVCNKNILGKLKYILSKCYYQKGKYYSDLAILYMEESLEIGYIDDDTFEYLGLLYSIIGKHNESINYYLKAIKEKPEDMLYLVLAQEYYQVGEEEKAEEYLYNTLSKTDDFSIEQKSRFFLGNILIDKGEYDKAEEEYRKILEKNEKSADAHYYLGEIYEKKGDNIKARYEWRKCLEIDSYHYGAKLKLYG